MHIRAARLNRRQRLVCVDMASSCAILEFADRIKNGHWLYEFRVRLRPETGSVTSRAVWFVGSEFPRNRLRIRGVAGAAFDRRPVIGIEWRTVPIGDRCPCRCAMAGIARQRRHEMLGSRSSRRRTVVTTYAPRRQSGMVQPRTGEGDSALVTTVTRRVGHEMPWRLAYRGRSRMTGGAGRSDATMIQPGAGKRGRALMAALTGCSGRNVSCGFTDGTNARMTRGARRADAAVI